MKIELTGNYKSLNDFNFETESKLIILTGENGTGKTNFLNLINESPSIRHKVRIDTNPSFIVSNLFNSRNLGIGDNTFYKKAIEEAFDTYDNFVEIKKEFAKYCHNYRLYKKSINHGHVNRFISVLKKDGIDIKEIKEGLNLATNPTDNDLESIYQILSKIHNLHLGIKGYKLIIQASQELNVSEKEIRLGHIFNSNISLKSLEILNQLNNPQLEKIFHVYAKLRNNNYINYLLQKDSGSIKFGTALTDKEFVKKYKIPWVYFNSLLKSIGLDYEVIGPDLMEYNDNINYKYELRKKSINKNIEIQFLSSGEKKIFSLISTLFIADDNSASFNVPELILLDEPDSNLHPDLTKLLIKTINDLFVKRLGITVLMVTHSPSTIALCPEESIFKMQNYPKSNIEKISKEEALKNLTKNIPVLSIDYNNHKQILCEGENDRDFFNKIFNKLKENDKIDTNFQPYFLTLGAGKANRYQVEKLVTEFRNYGNNRIYGIVDWDMSNKKPKKGIFIHGENIRYSLESFLFDPIYITTLLLDKEMCGIHNELGLDKDYNISSIIGYSSNDLQKRVDWFFSKIYDKNPGLKEKKKSFTKQRIEYFNGKSVELDSWAVIEKGHNNYFNYITNAFNGLGEKYKSDTSLNAELINTCSKLYPLIPKETYNLLNLICKDH
jgi:energy-coupling factor transporter ATP-binding protein EcfA2